MWILRILWPIKFCKGPIKISNGPLKFGNLHVFEWDMGHWPISRAHHPFGLGLTLFGVGCFSYSNLTYPLGIGPLGCEYSTLLYSLSSFCVCSLSGLRQFSPSNTRSCPLYRSIPFGIPRILGRTYPVQTD